MVNLVYSLIDALDTRQFSEDLCDFVESWARNVYAPHSYNLMDRQK